MAHNKKTLQNSLHARLGRTVSAATPQETPSVAQLLDESALRPALRTSGIEQVVSLTSRPPAEIPQIHLVWLDPHKVRLNPGNFRTEFDDEKVESIANSMKLEGIGVIEPVIVRPVEMTGLGRTDDGCDYECVAGDNRILASRVAGVWLPVLVREITDRVARRINWIENIQRADTLNAADAANALLTLRADLMEELGEWENRLATARGAAPAKVQSNEAYWTDAVSAVPDLPAWVVTIFERAVETGRRPKVTWEDVGAATGMKKRNLMYWRGVANLDDEVLEEVRTAGLNMYQARAVESLPTKGQQKRLVKEIKRGNLSGYQANARAREMTGRTRPAPRSISFLKGTPQTVAALSAEHQAEADVAAETGDARDGVTRDVAETPESGTPLAMLQKGLNLWETATQLVVAGYASPQDVTKAKAQASRRAMAEYVERMKQTVEQLESSALTEASS